VLVCERHGFFEWDDGPSVDHLGLDLWPRLEYHLYRTIEVGSGQAFFRSRDFEPIEERRPGVEIGLVDGDEQRIVLWVASDLVATAGQT